MGVRWRGYTFAAFCPGVCRHSPGRAQRTGYVLRFEDIPGSCAREARGPGARSAGAERPSGTLRAPHLPGRPRTARLRFWASGRPSRRRRHRPRPCPSRLSLPEASGAPRAGAPQKAFPCPFLPACGERREPEGGCLRPVRRGRPRSAVGTASEFLKNDFNQVRPLPGRGREGGDGLGRGERPGGLSWVCTSAARVSGAPRTRGSRGGGRQPRVRVWVSFPP